MTGWALDDLEVTGVTICRDAVVGEPAPVDGNCGGAAQIFVGRAEFIEGARPDVQAAFPDHPRNDVGGWGFMVLTNTLPNQGNGMFVFYGYARDRDGHVVRLGTRTMTCDNANATAPFGTIDTPGQGEIVGGSSYVNFGWALTQNPKYIPQDGSTLMCLSMASWLATPPTTTTGPTSPPRSRDWRTAAARLVSGSSIRRRSRMDCTRSSGRPPTVPA